MDTGVSGDEVTSYEGGSYASSPDEHGLPRVGRFHTLKLLGTGATAAVFSAYDPDLDRKIALKLIALPCDGGTARTRVQREIQAMARVTHPNTVQIFDVGDHGSGIYIAMELIEGQTLRMWSAAQVRPWRDVVAVFVQAGQGLQAAHDAGLVHRDFKPANVLLDRENHVRVADFGLARGREGDDEEARPARVLPEGSCLSSEVTMAGGLVGTPAYMAPELWLGEPADTRSDQYAFAVALYEGLYGARPFPEHDTDRLREAVLGGVLAPTPLVDPPIPPWLRRAVLRGLSPDPGLRFPSIRDFVAAIDRDPSRIWRRRLMISTLVLALPALFVAALLSPSASPCDDVEAHLLGVWDETRREEVSAALRSNQRSGPDVAAQIEGALDRFGRRWSAMRRESCEQSLREGEAHVLSERRIACLDDRLARVRPVVDMLANLDGAQVIAAEVTAHIPSLDRCADAESMLAVTMLPDDPQVAAAVEELRLQLAQAHADTLVGERIGAKALIDQAIERALALDYGQVYAEAILALSRLQAVDPELLIADLERAMVRAEEAGDHRLRLALALELLIYNSKLRRFYAAGSWDTVIDGLAPRFESEPLVVARISRAKGVFAGYNNDNNEAIKHTQRAVAAFTRAGTPNSPSASASRSNLGALLSRVHRYREAETVLRAAYADASREFGREHVATLSIYMNLTTSLARAGKGPAATEVMIEHLRRAPNREEHSVGAALRIVRVLFEPNSLLAPDAPLALLPQLDASLRLIAEADLSATHDVDEAAIESAYRNGQCNAEVLLELPSAVPVCAHAVGLAEDLLERDPAGEFRRQSLREALLGLALAERRAGREAAIATLRRAIDAEQRDVIPSRAKLIQLYAHLRRWEDEAGHGEAAAVAASALSELREREEEPLLTLPPSDLL